MVRSHSISKKFRAYDGREIDKIPQLAGLPPEDLLAMKAVASVLPIRVNNYVVDELIRWETIPDDPIYRMTFPQKEMLDPDDLERMVRLLKAGASKIEVQRLAAEIRGRLNPHPAGQKEMNVPVQAGRPLPGMQHKYRETVLFFPRQGQTCHAYCTYCFRWAQFIGDEELRFAASEVEELVDYLREHPEVSDVLITGGDPAIMRTSILRRYIEPLLAPELEHLTSIRIGTKAPAYWPYRFLTDRDSDDLLRLFNEVRQAGKHLALMAHFTHPRELETPAAEAAIRRIIRSGAVVRCQAPLIRHVNDDPTAWSRMWKMQVQLGAIPYYMFVERDTGPKDYFTIPLARAHEIFRQAYCDVSGLARTVRGPSMSATPGKVVVDGIAKVAGEKVFSLKLLQARDPDWVGRPFFAKYDPTAVWLDDLEPAFGADEFFFESELKEMHANLRDSVLDGPLSRWEFGSSEETVRWLHDRESMEELDSEVTGDRSSRQ